MIPKILYKYRAFNALTIENLVTDKIFFGDPSSFNDPLDTKPYVIADIELHVMERVLKRMVETRVKAEMTAAAKSIKYQGPRTADHIEAHSKKQAERLVTDIAYNAENPDYHPHGPQMQLSILASHIQDELLRQYDKGVFCLAKGFRSNLMWSHYGDQHHGLCAGYSVPIDQLHNIHEVTYGTSRVVNASKVEKMLLGDTHIKKELDAEVLSRKAKTWSYENEWRLLGQRGLQPSPLELKEIIFGTRCPESVKHCVVKALDGLVPPISFFEMRETSSNYKLVRNKVDIDELDRNYPYRTSRLDFD